MEIPNDLYCSPELKLAARKFKASLSSVGQARLAQKPHREGSNERRESEESSFLSSLSFHISEPSLSEPRHSSGLPVSLVINVPYKYIFHLLPI